jgi:hypothetical protein
MNMQNNRIDGQPSPFLPSDEELVEYLLGSVESNQRTLIEGWLATDEQAGERLTEIATLMCSVELALKATNAVTENAAATGTAPLRSSARFRIVIGLAVAAAFGLIAFSISGFGNEEAETQVAMAWVESLSLHDESDIQNIEPDEISSSEQINDPELVAEGDQLVATDDFDDMNSDMDFMSDEPPDWLLVAVTDMHQGDAITDPTEATP